MSATNVPGIGTVCDGLKYTTGGINYDNAPDMKNHHNEDGVVINTQKDSSWVWPFSMANDTTTVEFSCTPSTCDLNISMDSEVKMDLYNGGHFQATFDRTQRQWSLKAYKDASNTEWEFCNPGVAFQQVNQILTLLAKDSDKSIDADCGKDATLLDFNALLTSVAQSLGQGKDHAITSAKLYSQPADCSRESEDFKSRSYTNEGTQENAIYDF